MVVDALKDVLVQLLGLRAVESHAQNDQGVSQSLHHHPPAWSISQPL